MKVIAVEPALNNVKEYLESQGCSCVEMSPEANTAQDACCCVVTGADKNLMGMQDVVQDVPVVSAEGMTPGQVYDRVKEYL